VAYVGPISPVSDTSSGDRLRARMESDGVTQAELSRRTGISRRTINDLVNGRHDGNVSTWRAIARGLRCGIDDIRD
jgi:transcriptional regulator with XRE-family HTH domain